MEDDIRLDLTKEQKAGMASLKRAFNKCKKAGIYFHNCYGDLFAYNSEFVETVDDDEDTYECHEGTKLDISYDLASWADDAHYIHFINSDKKDFKRAKNFN